MDARRAIPGPRPFPLLGRWVYLRRFRRDPLGSIQRLTATYGPIAALTAADQRLVVAGGAVSVRQLLADPERFQPLQAGDQRQAPLNLMPLIWGAPPPRPLPEQAVPALATIALEQVEALLERWGIGQAVDVAYVLPRLARRVVLALLLGRGAPDDPGLQAAIAPAGSLAAAPPLRAVAALAAWLRDRGRMSHPDAPFDLARLVAHMPGSEPVDLLWRLIAAADRLGLSLGWVLLLLSQHPRVLAEAEREIRHVAGERPPALEELADLRLLDRIIREGQRLLPPLALGARRTIADATLEPYRLRAGTLVLYSPVLTQRAEPYIAPLHFRPERWLYLEPSPASFHPFGLGPDLWDAAPWLPVVGRLILARLLQRYRLAFAPGERIDWAGSVLLQPRAGLPMIIGARDRPLIRRAPGGAIRALIALP